VQKADLSKPFKEEIKAICNKNQELLDIHSDIVKQKEIIATSKSEENFIESCKELPRIPTNAVQFLLNWKKYTSLDFRYRYLKVGNKLLHMKSIS